jgi:hypothetical protein
MASVLSESPSSTTITATISSPAGLGTFQIRPSVSRIREGSYILGEETGQTQLKSNRLVAEVLHGESSSELRNAELGRAATRVLMSFGLNQREKRRRIEPEPMDVDMEEGSQTDNEGWESIQDYGNFLRETADTFGMDTSMPPPPEPRRTVPARPEKPRIQESTQISPIDRLSGPKFRFTADFAHLAPLTARENRIQAQQSGKLIEWLSDTVNDRLFRGWGGLDQVVDAPPSPEEAQNQRQAVEVEALQRILEVPDDQSSNIQFHGTGELGWGSGGARGQNTFAKYLSQEAPQSSSAGRLDPRLTSIDPSRSSSMLGSDEDCRSVVSQDNHWRRTIFG